MGRAAADAAYREARPQDAEGQIRINVPQILNFTQNMQAGQLVFISGRYDSVGQSERNVYIYGVARIISEDGQCYYYDAASTWHRCKRHAHIQRIEQALPRNCIMNALQRGSFVPTIMRLEENALNALEKVLQTELGVVVAV